MNRRDTLTFLTALVALEWSAAHGAQAPGKQTLIGLLDAGERLEWWNAFRDRMTSLGYVEGRNVAYEQRFAKGDVDALPAMAKSLVTMDVAVIVTSGAAAALAARRATSKIPIVMASGTDQVNLGLVSTLGRPGGNITGVSSLTSELMDKRLELLRETLPKSTRFAALWHSDNVPSMASVRDLEGATARNRLAFRSFGVRASDEIPDAFRNMAHDHTDGLIVVNSPFIYGQRQQVVDLASQYKVPAIYGASEYAEAGGLMSYAPSYSELFRHAAVYVDRILKGAKAGDMPIEQPTAIELVINAKTARALAIVMPQAMLSRANQIIQ